MVDLVACLSTGKGSWKNVTSVIEGDDWDNIFLITNEFGKKNFTKDGVELIVVDRDQTISDLSEEIRKKLSGGIEGTEVALNFESGTGKEHMALLNAVMQLGFGFRLVSVEYGDIEVY